jgi:hypothetical protein
VIKKPVFTFPLVFEAIIWFLYVALYKYSFYVQKAGLPHILNNDLPYLEICVYSICSTLILVPYYRWAIPSLMQRKRYLLVVLVTLGWFILLVPWNNFAVSWVGAKLTEGQTVNHFFTHSTRYWELDLILTDFIAFFCIALARFSYQNELQRHKIETDHLQLQLTMLKTQLQPHFLFNTLNSLYGMSLTGSKETPRFILLLSQMMQYILYDCDQEEVTLEDETNFLKGYFEIEQKKFPNAAIMLDTPTVNRTIKIPPLLFLPLVENSFKHGRHKLEDKAGVTATLNLSGNRLIFSIKNDKLDPLPPGLKKKPGGIGLVNIRKRLDLYYPDKYQLTINEINNQYIAEVIINLS